MISAGVHAIDQSDRQSLHVWGTLRRQGGESRVRWVFYKFYLHRVGAGEMGKARPGSCGPAQPQTYQWTISGRSRGKIPEIAPQALSDSPHLPDSPTLILTNSQVLYFI